MADSDSEQFESADEGFSDVEDTATPPGSTINETSSKDHHTSSSTTEDHDVSLVLKNLSLNECNLSLNSKSAEAKQTISLSEETLASNSKPEEKIEIGTGKSLANKPETVSNAKKVDVNLEKNTDSFLPIISSKQDVQDLPASRLTPKDSVKDGSFTDLNPQSNRTDESQACSGAKFAEEPNLKSVIEASAFCNLERAGSFPARESCDSSQSPKIGSESSVIQETVDETLWNDGWEVENSKERNSALPAAQCTVENSKTSDLRTSVKDNFREENVDEGWDDGWEVDDAFEKMPKPVSLQSTSESSDSVSNHKFSTQSSSTTSRTDSTCEKKSESALVQSKPTNSESTLNPKSLLESNLKEEDACESSWNDGWETVGFKAGSADPKSGKTKTEAVSGLIKKERSKDAGWNDGWDTEEVNFSPDSSEGREPSSQALTSKSVAVEKENLRANEKKVPIETVPNEAPKLAQQNQDGWFGWGVTNILSSATEGLSSITSNVTSAFETTIGAPDPTEILRAQKEASLNEETVPCETKSQEGGFADNLFSVSSWTKFVESTGSKVLTTGLDTLETIGKKTMEVIQEGDPGLKKKRAKLREFVSEPGKPVLSQVLREAKEKAETSSRTNEAALIESRVNFEILFDDFEGLVHLEALEMISKQCQIKLDSLALKFSGSEAKNFKETLQEVEELCELPEDDETNSKEAMADGSKFKLRTKEVLDQLGVDIQYDKLLQTNEIVESRLQKDYSNPLELHQIVISSLAEISAAAMQIFHRAAEMLVIKSKHSTIAETDSLMSFGKLVCSKLEVTAEKFSSKLKKIDPSDTAKVSHISKEATNSTTYTQNACQLLVPILQYGAVI